MRAIASLGRPLLDFVLPPRCAACGTIVEAAHSFCADCWKSIDFLGNGGCAQCGLPLEATDAETCGACLASPPRIARARAAVAYDEVTRGLAIHLKYGRKVALARTMGRFMAPLVDKEREAEAVLVPVPLHRGRLWRRGFNQSALIAGELSRRLGIRTDPMALVRVKPTPPLKGMGENQRRRTVSGAFAIPRRESVTGRRVILVDDVMTTGSTADACARALQRAGAQRVDLVCWARVVRPTRV